MGALFFIFQERIFLSKRLFGIGLLVIFYALNYKVIFFPVYTILYAFPVQQSIAALVPTIDVARLFIYAFVVTLSLAILSWHFIEKPALQLKAT